MIRKLLIANRGEIAVRVIRAARELGIRTVAVFSEADRLAMHVQLADEAVFIGPSEASASYLDSNAILAAARQTGADAVHPGYGFLSERAEFVDACEEAGITFVGPSAAAMRALGSKMEAKALAVRAGVPIVPGRFDPGASVGDLKVAAGEIGYPVLLKASAGGGGRGMRVVSAPDEFEEQFHLASEEAERAFGDGAMMVEKLVERPRHVEVQVLADHFGNAWILYERECSIQRRHQKLIEESPSPVMSPELWERMEAAARALVREAAYTNAGTVEFIVDAEGKNFYFLEVNARLQVEHPVTELVTGVDLAQWQLRIASGEGLAGERPAQSGHAIELRIIAEDPGKGFLPSIGKILAWAEPTGPGIRVDTGFSAGDEVSRYYDSLLAKLIVTGATREQAIRRAVLALQDFHILGVRTNIEFLIAVLLREEFVRGDIDTGFLQRAMPDWEPPEDIPFELGAIAASASSLASGSPMRGASGVWGGQDNFRNARG
jgi:acetyl-CoA carboxylase biotin carboxylase subunit